MRERSDQPPPRPELADRISDDAQIFFAAVLGMAGVLLTHWLLASLVGLDGETQTLVSRLGPPSTILPFSVFLVFVPAVLAFLAIGLPFAMRTLVALVRWSLGLGQALGLLGLVACVVVAVVEIHAGGNGVVALLMVALISAVESGAILGRCTGALGWRLLAAAAVALFGLGYYEYLYLAGGRVSIAVAPTLLLASFFLLGAALILLTASEFSQPGQPRLTILLAWLIAISWYAAPRLRPLTATAHAGDQLEFCATITAAAALLLLAAGKRRWG